MQRELNSFPLPVHQKVKLYNAGFVTVEDLEDVKPLELTRAVGLPPDEVRELLHIVRGARPRDGAGDADCSLFDEVSSRLPTAANISKRALSAYDMLREEQGLQTIITFSEAIDSLLGGGVPLSRISEICGPPGIGKTQLCMQLAVDVQIPEVFGGLEGTAFYIDTEGSLIIDRLKDIAAATVQHCEHIANMENNEEQQGALSTFTVESILSNIQYFRCYDYVELMALVHLLPKYIQEHPKVGLIIVDSIAFHFRHEFEDYGLRTRILNGMAQNFIKIAALNKLAVVITNQMTTKIGVGPDASSHLVPALGESWSHAAAVRLILQWNGQQRQALLCKSPSRPESTAPFQITMAGVRDVAMVDARPVQASTDVATAQPPPAKRQRTEQMDAE